MQYFCKRSKRGHLYGVCRSAIAEQSHEVMSDTSFLPSVNVEILSDASTLFEDVSLDYDPNMELSSDASTILEDVSLHYGSVPASFDEDSVFNENAFWISDSYLLNQVKENALRIQKLEHDMFMFQQELETLKQVNYNTHCIPRVEKLKSKNRRHTTSLYAKQHLIHAYDLNNGCMPSQETRCEIAKAVDMTVKQITDWFSNRRKRDTGK